MEDTSLSKTIFVLAVSVSDVRTSHTCNITRERHRGLIIYSF